ncbi:MAG: ABC transporter ATP-binding protein, partial [Clostridia bacterium]|nr:ABC transporter ATP-binding protein [Clostridia bacterium]
NVRGKLFNHVMGLGQQEMLEFSVPSLITRTTNDITQVQMLIAMGLQIFIKAPVMAVWAVIKILGKSRELSFVTAGFVVVISVSVRCIMLTVLPRFRFVQKLTDKINKVVRENLTGINVVHAFNAEEYQNDKFDKVNTEMMKTQLFNQRMFSFMQPIMTLGMNGLSLSIYWVGAALLNAIAFTDVAARLGMFSDIVVFSTYATHVVISFMMMVMIFMMLPPALISAERINAVLDRKPNVKEGSVNEGREVGTVEFKNVTFRYPDAGEDELIDISFKVNRGETLAIIGATGSGKTTLISLIPRFFDATKGEVLVDGVNVRDYTFDALYNRLGYVTQKAVLFAGSIKENITFGESAQTTDDADVDKAIELAQAAEFVNRLEGGKEYSIAQAGKNVSGGQKQRISIARALARRSEILIFDDSFSALDYRTDAMLRAGLEKELGGTTKIIVAQRISTIRNADKIIVLDDGRMAGMGTHDELMKNCEIYREIAVSQLSARELA